MPKKRLKVQRPTCLDIVDGLAVIDSIVPEEVIRKLGNRHSLCQGTIERSGCYLPQPLLEEILRFLFVRRSG